MKVLTNNLCGILFYSYIVPKWERPFALVLYQITHYVKQEHSGTMLVGMFYHLYIIFDCKTVTPSKEKVMIPCCVPLLSELKGY